MESSGELWRAWDAWGALESLVKHVMSAIIELLVHCVLPVLLRCRLAEVEGPPGLQAELAEPCRCHQDQQGELDQVTRHRQRNRLNGGSAVFAMSVMSVDSEIPPYSTHPHDDVPSCSEATASLLEAMASLARSGDRSAEPYVKWDGGNRLASGGNGLACLLGRPVGRTI
eukprot:3342233-Alexandrium_andersonii.AAC.2